MKFVQKISLHGVNKLIVFILPRQTAGIFYHNRLHHFPKVFFAEGVAQDDRAAVDLSGFGGGGVADCAAFFSQRAV